MTRWYVAYTQARAEQLAAIHLKRQGFNFYLPQTLQRRSHARKVEIVRTPLFPRYIFIRFDAAAEPWRAINGTLGISRLIANGDIPLPVADSVIDGIRVREDAKGLVETSEIESCRPGDKVRIVAGPLAGREGLFAGSSEQRVRVLLELLGREVALELNPRLLATA
jgi:transcriptional antiterminator RfaH